MRTHLQGLLALLLIGALPAFAQATATCTSATPAICNLFPPSNPVQVKPQAVPTGSAVAVTSVDAYLQTVTVSNTTSGALTFSLCDRQASPICLLPAVSIAANALNVVVWAGPAFYWCPAGFTVLASGSGLTWYAGWRQ